MCFYRKELREAYRVCNIFHRLISSVSGLLKYGSLYMNDGHILSLTNTANHAQNNDILHMLMNSLKIMYLHKNNEEICNITQRCGSMLINLGVSSIYIDQWGRCPLILAGLLGYDKLLLDMIIAEGFERNVPFHECPDISDIKKLNESKNEEKVRRIDRFVKKNKQFK